MLVPGGPVSYHADAHNRTDFQEPVGVNHRLRSALASGRRRWLSPDVLNVAQRLRFRSSDSAAWSAGASPNLAFVGYSDRLLVSRVKQAREE